MVHTERLEVVVELVCDDGVRPAGYVGECMYLRTSAFSRSGTMMPDASPLSRTSKRMAAPRGETGGTRSSWLARICPPAPRGYAPFCRSSGASSGAAPAGQRRGYKRGRSGDQNIQIAHKRSGVVNGRGGVDVTRHRDRTARRPVTFFV